MDDYAQMMTEVFEKKAHKEAGYAIAYSLMQLAKQQEMVAIHLKYLGTGDAATRIGAVEFLAMETKGIATALSEVADALRRE